MDVCVVYVVYYGQKAKCQSVRTKKREWMKYKDRTREHKTNPDGAFETFH